MVQRRRIYPVFRKLPTLIGLLGGGSLSKKEHINVRL